MTSIKDDGTVKILPLLVKMADIEFYYHAIVFVDPDFWHGELNLTYSNFHGWNWADAKNQFKRSQVLPIDNLIIQGLKSKVTALKGWTFEGITKEEYASLIRRLPTTDC